MNETHWQYYGTSDTRGNLSLTWDTSVLPTPAVTIELWGYEETGGAYKGWMEVSGTFRHLDVRGGVSGGDGGRGVERKKRFRSGSLDQEGVCS